MKPDLPASGYLAVEFGGIATPVCTQCSWRGDRYVFHITAWGDLDHHLFEVHGWTAADVEAEARRRAE